MRQAKLIKEVIVADMVMVNTQYIPKEDATYVIVEHKGKLIVLRQKIVKVK